MDNGFLFSKKMWALVMVLLVVLMAAAAFALQFSGEKTEPPTVIDRNNTSKALNPGTETSKAVFKVSNMSCSGCISTIKGALAGVQGIEEVLVGLGSGTAEVYFRQESGADAATMAKAITDSGYPASIVKVFSAEEIQKKRALAASKSKYYVASVSGYDIARADFDMEMKAARKQYQKDNGADLFSTPRGQALEQRLKGQILSRLIDQGTLLQEINRSGFNLDDGTLKAELKAYIEKNGKSEQALEQAVREAGYDYDYFKKRFETGVLINRFVDEKVLAGAETPDQKQRAFADWYNNARNLAKVVYYDKALEQSIRQQSASGSCCAAR
ncbi:MAG: SurA N-terminal domain-containing protein [Deltaproteobacteria bacterium]|nr:SurA N-terminal domain-containing protein [Deltaproteobacteria bacterium]